MTSALVPNILKTWESANDSQVSIGRAWYLTAHNHALRVSGGDAVKGSGVIAALSPNLSWARNLVLAERAFVDGPYGTFGDSIRKTQRILDGENPSIVLPAESKTWNFYHCILDPYSADHVCIDRHAHDVAVGVRFGETRRNLDRPSKYAAIADAYRSASDVLGEVPSIVQAVTWVTWRDSTMTRA